MSDEKKLKEPSDKTHKLSNYSICRASCSVCPYHKGLLKLLDHGAAIVPTLPEPDK